MPPSITEDEFLAWYDHPVTRWVREGLSREAELVRADWIGGAWDADQLDPATKTRAHARWDILDHIANQMTHREVQGYHESADT